MSEEDTYKSLPIEDPCVGIPYFEDTSDVETLNYLTFDICLYFFVGLGITTLIIRAYM
jgi:hypothetical protein